VTRGEIIDRILTGLNEATVGPVFWTRAQIAQGVNDGAALLAEELASIKRTALVGLAPGCTYYRTRGIAQDCMAPYRIWIPGRNRKLIPVTVEQLDAFHLEWNTVTGDPEYWAPMGHDWFAVYPHPAQGGGIMKVDYLAWPRELTDDDDRPEFPEADHDSLVLHGVYDGYLKRWAVPEAMTVFAQFADRFSKGKARSGVNQLNGRTWQKSQAPNPGFNHGIGQRASR
jgi:hypothetical protein